MVGRCCCLRLASITFISHVGFSTTILALVLDSLVRVSRRVGKNHFDKIAQGPSSRLTPSQHGVKLGFPLRTASGIIRLHLASLRRCTARMFVSAPQSDAVEFISTASASTISSLLTLFSKCFSSFLHSTCSLSVSYTYLALEEVHSYQSTRLFDCQPGRSRHHIRGSHPLWRSARGHFCVSTG
jgi:hypothetical protein